MADNLKTVQWQPSDLPAHAGNPHQNDKLILLDLGDGFNPKTLDYQHVVVDSGARAQLAGAFTGASISGDTVTLARSSGLNPRVLVIPTGMGVADGVIVSANVDAAQETVTVTTGTGDTVQWDLTAILDVLRALIAGVSARVTALEAQPAAAASVYLGPYSNLSQPNAAPLRLATTSSCTTGSGFATSKPEPAPTLPAPASMTAGGPLTGSSEATQPRWRASTTLAITR